MNLTVEYYKKKAREFVQSDMFHDLQSEWTRDLMVYVGGGVMLRFLYSMSSQTLEEPAGSLLGQNPLLLGMGLIFALLIGIQWGKRLRNWMPRLKKPVGKLMLIACLLLYDAAMFFAGWTAVGLVV